MKRILSFLLLFSASIALAAGPQPCYYFGQYVKCFPPLGLLLDGATQGLTVGNSFTMTGMFTSSSNQTTGANTLANINSNESSGGPNPIFNFIAGRGTYASPVALQSLDPILTMNFASVYSTTANNVASATSAQIQASTTEAQTASNHGGQLAFKTQANSAGAFATRMTIKHDGGVNIAETTGGTGNVPHECNGRQNTGSGANVSASCNAGERLTGGGCDSASTVALSQSYPTSNTTWQCTWVSGVTSPRATVMCCVY